MPKNAGLGNAFRAIMADSKRFLAISETGGTYRYRQPLNLKEYSMDSLVETLFLHRLSKNGFLEKTKVTEDGHIEVIPQRFYAGGTCLLKPVGKSLVVSATNLSFRLPVEYTVRDHQEYFYIGLRCGTVRDIKGAHIEKEKIYHPHISSGTSYCEVGVSFLPEFFDTFLNSRHGVSPDEIAQAIDALGKLPLISDAAVILKQIGEVSFTGDVGNIWIEAKALELAAVVLDWHRRRRVAAEHPLKEHDRVRIAEAIRYAEEHFSGPLTLETLARQAAMSISKFTAVFKRHTGSSAGTYINRLRMEKAMGLLKNTQASIVEIADIVGYKYPTSFSTAFREQFGVMPSDFRKRE
jgi:AraC-like DNA-binding protein